MLAVSSLQSLAGEWICSIWSSLYGQRPLRHVSEPLPYTEGQRSCQFIQQPLSADSEGFPHQGLDVGAPSCSPSSHFHAHHSGKNGEGSLSVHSVLIHVMMNLIWTHTSTNAADWTVCLWLSVLQKRTGWFLHWLPFHGRVQHSVHLYRKDPHPGAVVS